MKPPLRKRCRAMPDVSPPPPLLHPVRKLRSEAPALEEVEGAVRKALAPLLESRALPEGAPVAVTCGSRGIDRIAEVVGAACAALREAGARPFIVPAMGSHGNATAEGQRRVLAEYGVTEQNVGTPVVSSLETATLGCTAERVEVFMDRAAWEAGRVLVVNRVKPHTTFDGQVESGLFKMMSVGLGKLDGARSFHRHSMRLGFAPILLAMGRLALNSGRIWAGLGLVENDEHRLAEVAAAPAAGIEALERHLLVCARRLYSRLPFSDLELLIVDEMGKNISGTGMDTKVIGRTPHPGLEPLRLEGATHVRRIYVRDLTPQSEGNATGVGFADVIHRRLFEKIDLAATYTNGRAALSFNGMRVPMHFPTDREAVEFLLGTLGSPEPGALRAVRIRNTLALSEFLATPACARQLQGNENYECGPARALQFDESGALVQLATSNY